MDNITPPKKSNRLIVTIIILIIAAPFFWIFLGRLIMNGSFNNCEYREKIISPSPELLGSTIMIEQDMYVAKGKNPTHCTVSFENINLQIINPDSINNITIGKQFYERQARTIEIFNEGKTFSLIKIVSQTRHGLSAIDSGQGPIIYLILKDQQDGNIYEIAAMSLEDINEVRGPFFGYYKNGQRTGTLKVEMFQKF